MDDYTYGLTLSSAPASEPITTAEAKTHLRVDTSDDDTYIDTLITAARRYCEGVQNRAYINQTWVLSLDEWPSKSYMELPRAPLSSVTSIAYLDTAGASSTWDSANYIAQTAREPGRIYLADGISWPIASLYPAGGVRITYVAGYGATESSVPAQVKHMIKLLVGHWYEAREPIIQGGSGIGGLRTATVLPYNLEALLQMDRVW